jgi:biopolymer transport protein ExbD
MRRFKRKKRAHAAVETSALSDILFFLMLFFLMVSTLAGSQAMKLSLPNAETSAEMPKQTIYVTIDADRKYYINNQECRLADVRLLLGQQVSRNSRATVVLRTDKTITMNEFTAIADVVNQLHIPLVLATEKQ